MKFGVFLLPLYISICHTSEIWYQSEISSYLVPPFHSLYTILQNNIIDKVLAIDSKLLTTNHAEISSFATNLQCQVGKLLQNLNTSVTVSTNISEKVSNTLSIITNNISNKESEIARIESQIRGVNANIQAKQSQIRIAEESVKQSEASVELAENELHQAELEVEAAKLCAGLFQRRKRFLSSFWNPLETLFVKPMGFAMDTAGNIMEAMMNTASGVIVNTMVKPICTVVNFQKVDSAKKNVESKKGELTFFRSLVETYKADLNSIHNDLILYNSQLQSLNNELNQLQSLLMQLPDEQHIIVSINQKLVNAASYMRTLFGKSVLFLDVITKLIDFEFVVLPLNAVYDELEQNQFIVGLNLGKISAVKINQAKAKLQTLVSSKFNFPWNMENLQCLR